MSKQTNKANAREVMPAEMIEQRTDVPALNVPRAVARDWKRVALITVASIAIAWGLAAMQTPRYRASALASVAPLGDALQPNELMRGVEVLERRTIVATIAALASTPVTRTDAGAPSGYDVMASVLPNTNLFRVDVEGADGAQAAAIANRVPSVLNGQTRAMYKYYGVTMVSQATTPDAPYMPRTGRAIFTGLLIGLFLGVLVTLATHWRSVRRGSAV